jgi:hypothetical protein
LTGTKRPGSGHLWEKWKMSEELGPLLVAPPAYLAVRKLIRHALGFPDERRPLLIGIDGLDGSGKSGLAAWLSWQLEMPAVHLDTYIIRDRAPWHSGATTSRPRWIRALILGGQ